MVLDEQFRSLFICLRAYETPSIPKVVKKVDATNQHVFITQAIYLCCNLVLIPQ